MGLILLVTHALEQEGLCDGNALAVEKLQVTQGAGLLDAAEFRMSSGHRLHDLSWGESVVPGVALCRWRSRTPFFEQTIEDGLFLFLKFFSLAGECSLLGNDRRLLPLRKLILKAEFVLVLVLHLRQGRKTSCSALSSERLRVSKDREGPRHLIERLFSVLNWHILHLGLDSLVFLGLVFFLWPVCTVDPLGIVRA